jgi:GNAT superfamily N-acetyltransferase
MVESNVYLCFDMKDHEIILRRAVRTDVPAMHALVRELAIYEKAEEQHTLSLEQMEEDGFGPTARYEAFIAERCGEVLGMAMYYARYSSWKGKTLHLEDIVVRELERGAGIGALLFEAVLDKAAEWDVGRMEFEVLGWNESAKRFYGRYGITGDPEWELWKVMNEELRAWAAKRNGNEGS